MPWELLGVGAAIVAFIFSSLKGSKGEVVADAALLDRLNRIRQSSADKERARIADLEAEITRKIEKRANVQEDPNGAVDRLRDEFGSG